MSMINRSAEKESERRDDERRLASGEVTPADLAAANGFFSVLDRTLARIVSRRRRVIVRPEHDRAAAAAWRRPGSAAMLRDSR